VSAPSSESKASTPPSTVFIGGSAAFASFSVSSRTSSATGG
jgi:hypothetical protein